jgi:hypothetical protein
MPTSAAHQNGAADRQVSEALERVVPLRIVEPRSLPELDVRGLDQVVELEGRRHFAMDVARDRGRPVEVCAEQSISIEVRGRLGTPRPY